MKLGFTGGLLVLVATQAHASEDQSAMRDCPMHAQHQATPAGGAVGKAEDHFAAVNRRGDSTMGFSHERTVHHFKLTPNGGVISAEASDPEDATSRDAIRSHFAHIASEFSSGNFEMPMLIHAKTPPGVANMKKLKKHIQYRPEQIDRGGRILIVTQDPKALAAIHQFLRFQIEDHQTGDSTAISG